MAKETFAEFLARGLPFGEAVDYCFVYPALRDPALPDIRTWQDLRHYIVQRHEEAAPEIIKAAQQLWHLYERQR